MRRTRWSAPINPSPPSVAPRGRRPLIGLSSAGIDVSLALLQAREGRNRPQETYCWNKGSKEIGEAKFIVPCIPDLILFSVATRSIILDHSSLEPDHISLYSRALMKSTVFTDNYFRRKIEGIGEKSIHCEVRVRSFPTWNESSSFFSQLHFNVAQSLLKTSSGDHSRPSGFVVVSSGGSVAYSKSKYDMKAFQNNLHTLASRLVSGLGGVGRRGPAGRGGGRYQRLRGAVSSDRAFRPNLNGWRRGMDVVNVGCCWFNVLSKRFSSADTFSAVPALVSMPLQRTRLRGPTKEDVIPSPPTWHL